MFHKSNGRSIKSWNYVLKKNEVGTVSGAMIITEKKVVWRLRFQFQSKEAAKSQPQDGISFNS